MKNNERNKRKFISMQTITKIKVFAPATVANVSCGYEVLGFAVDNPGDEVELELNNSGKITLDHIEGDKGLLPRNAERNIASAVVMGFKSHIGFKEGVNIRLYKKMPLNSGMGSSSASSSAALVAI